MKFLKQHAGLKATALGMLFAGSLAATPAMAQIDYSEDFEGLDINSGSALTDSGWLVFANVFEDFPGCGVFLYNYGPFPAPNGGPGFSGVVVGSTGQALNAYSDYNNQDHGSGACIEANVFQERVVTAADAGDYTFAFDIEAPAPPDDMLGQDVATYGFIKLLDPNNNFNTDIFLTVDTTTAGPKSIDVTLDATADGKILQWGFANTASDFLPSGRWYDNVTFGPQAVAPPPPPPPVEPPAPPPPTQARPVAVDTLGDFGLVLLVLLVGLIGGTVITRRL